MTIAFYNPISAPFHNSTRAASNFNEMVDCCVENVNEFVDMIEKFHSVRNCELERCQIKLFFENLKLYLGKERKSSHLLRKFFFELSEAYPTGFRDCVSIAKKVSFDCFKERRKQK